MKEKLLVVGVVVALVLGGYAVSKKPVVVTKDGVQVGAVSSPDIGSYAVIGGSVLRGGATKSLTQATTTVCAIQSPAATSTLLAGSIKFSVSSTTASTITIGKATTPFATTTLLRTESVGANAQATIPFASSTSVASAAAWALEQTNLTFAPNTYVVVGMAGGTGTFSPTGECRALFIEN